MNDDAYVGAIRQQCQPLEARPTDAEPKLAQLTDIRAVLFDVYGTLVISASGDIGANAGDHREAAISAVCEQFNLPLTTTPAAAVDCLHAEISASHSRSKESGIQYPEVDIVAIWQAVLPQIADCSGEAVDFPRFALEYEVRVNPVWPMPGAEATLSGLRAAGIELGIVSNAQFFTPLLFRAFFGKSIAELGFTAELSYFSYEYGQAKPGNYLYLLAKEQLELRGVQPGQTLYVGNDLLNDVTAAASAGFRTALFAGDQRSLRLRNDDERVRGVVPDVIVTELAQLHECLATSEA